MVGTAVGRTHEVRGWGLVGALGALGFLTFSVVGTVVPGTDSTTGWQVVAAVSIALLLGAVVGVARSGATGPGWLGRTGLAISAAGCVALALGFTVEVVVGLEAVALYASGTGLLFAGPVLAGVAVVRARIWSGPWRWSLLGAGLVLLPALWFFGDDTALGAVVVNAWMLGWLWVAAALLRERA
jgi:hypothetical protein